MPESERLSRLETSALRKGRPLRTIKTIEAVRELFASMPPSASPAIDDTKGVDQSEARAFWERALRLLSESETARAGYTLLDLDNKNPGKYAFEVSTPTGIESFEGATRCGADVQSGLLDPRHTRAPVSRSSSTQDQIPPPMADLWLTVRDEGKSPSSRIQSLQSLLESDADGTFAFVVNELSRSDLTDDWRSALVFLAEDTHFPAQLRERLCESLLLIASSARRDGRAGVERVMCSAMRRFSSLLSPNNVNSLLAFLNPDGLVDTKAVALQCVVRVFQKGPPSNREYLIELSDRIFEFARKFLDRDVFIKGENALIAQNAVCALAAVGDPRLKEVFLLVRNLDRQWLNRQLALRLNQILSDWRSELSGTVPSPAITNLEELLASIN